MSNVYKINNISFSLSLNWEKVKKGITNHTINKYGIYLKDSKGNPVILGSSNNKSISLTAAIALNYPNKKTLTIIRTIKNHYWMTICDNSIPVIGTEQRGSKEMITGYLEAMPINWEENYLLIGDGIEDIFGSSGEKLDLKKDSISKANLKLLKTTGIKNVLIIISIIFLSCLLFFILFGSPFKENMARNIVKSDTEIFQEHQQDVYKKLNGQEAISFSSLNPELIWMINKIPLKIDGWNIGNMEFDVKGKDGVISLKYLNGSGTIKSFKERVKKSFSRNKNSILSNINITPDGKIADFKITKKLKKNRIGIEDLYDANEWFEDAIETSLLWKRRDKVTLNITNPVIPSSIKKHLSFVKKGLKIFKTSNITIKGTGIETLDRILSEEFFKTINVMKISILPKNIDWQINAKFIGK